MARNPSQLLKNPLINSTIGKIKETGFVKKCNDLYDNGKQIYEKKIKPTV